MSNRKLFILAITAALMIVLSVVVQWHISGRVRSIDSKQAVYLIQGLNPANIGAITIGQEPNTVRLIRRQNQFVAPDKDNYPASTKEINTLISSCLDIRTKELYTSDVSNHTDLGVTEEDARYIVKFFKSDTDTVPFSGVVIGNSAEQGPGAYVRLVNNNNVYFSEESPWIKTNTTDYMKQDILSVKGGDIISVDIISSKDKYTLKKQDDDSNTIVLENMPQGKDLKATDVKQVFEALTSLRFDDVMSAGKNNMKFNRQFVCRMKDSTVYTLKIAQKDNKTFIACSAEFTDTTPVTKKPGQVDSKEELKKKEAELLARDSAGKFTQKHKRWLYQISDLKAGNITKNISDLLEEKPKEEPRKETPPPT